MKKPHKKIYLGKYIFTVLLLLAAAGVWYWYAVAGKSDEALIGKAIEMTLFLNPVASLGSTSSEISSRNSLKILNSVTK